MCIQILACLEEKGTEEKMATDFGLTRANLKKWINKCKCIAKINWNDSTDEKTCIKIRACLDMKLPRKETITASRIHTQVFFKWYGSCKQQDPSIFDARFEISTSDSDDHLTITSTASSTGKSEAQFYRSTI